MHGGPGCLAGDHVVFVDDVKDLGGVLAGLSGFARVEPVGQIDPGAEREFFGAGGLGDPECRRGGRPGLAGRVGLEEFLQLFAALGEPLADEPVEEVTVESRKRCSAPAGRAGRPPNRPPASARRRPEGRAAAVPAPTGSEPGG